LGSGKPFFPGEIFPLSEKEGKGGGGNKWKKKGVVTYTNRKGKGEFLSGEEKDIFNQRW